MNYNISFYYLPMSISKRPYYIPTKPKPCDQIWEDMTPNEQGRICAKCEKQLLNFENMKWSEIVKTHQNSATIICGNYSNKQLENWGTEIPKWYDPYLKYLVSISFVKLLLTNHPIKAYDNFDSTKIVKQIYQNQISPEKVKTDSSIIIKGELIDYKTYEPIVGASVTLSDLTNVAITDKNGEFELKIDSLDFEHLDKIQNYIRLSFTFNSKSNFKYFSRKDLKRKNNIFIFDETFTFDPNTDDFYRNNNNEDNGFAPAKKKPPFFKFIYNSFIDLFKRGPYKW